MKKINLAVQTPCHEDWETMVPEERGRYCASCCKTVTDFTGMSDRQLAEFFKKPKENICGRFYADQLERDILIPRKRIPWVRYFFQFTWPAFVFFLKSCGQLTATKGKVVVTTEQPIQSEDLVTMGTPAIEIKPATISVEKLIDHTESYDLKEMVTIKPLTIDEGKVQKLDSIQPLGEIKNDCSEADTIVMSKKDMEPVTISYIPMVMGGIGVRGIELRSEKRITEVQVKSAPAPRIFPNPASGGSLITIAYKEDESIPDMVQIFTVAGQLVQQEKLSISNDASVFNLNLPSTLKPGMYLLRFTDTKNNNHHTEKLVIQ